MSTIRVNTIQNTSGVEVYTLRAIVTFQGTGTVTIREGKNVSSITDNGTGDYTINFTNALPSAEYGVAVLNGMNSGGQTIYNAILAAGTTSTTMTNKTTTACRITTFIDFGYISFMAA